jgi:hypothetical protein
MQNRASANRAGHVPGHTDRPVLCGQKAVPTAHVKAQNGGYRAGNSYRVPTLVIST